MVIDTKQSVKILEYMYKFYRYKPLNYWYNHGLEYYVQTWYVQIDL